MKYNKSLTTLNLHGNGIGDAVAGALAECLKYNKSLTTLTLDVNEIGEVGKVGTVFPGVKNFSSPLVTSTPDPKSSTERNRVEPQQTELLRCLKSLTSTKNVKNQE